MTFAPRRPYILLAPAALDLLLLTQPGPTYLRLLCLARASVLIGLTFAARWRKRTLALVVPLASVLACVWETCKSTLYKYPSAPGDGDGDGSGGGKGDWDEWYGPEASATYLAETPSPLPADRGFLFGSLRSAAALRKPSPLGPGRSCSAPAPPSGLRPSVSGATLGEDLAPSASSASLSSASDAGSLGTSPSPVTGPSPERLSPHSQRVVSGSSSGSAALRAKELRNDERSESADLVGPLRVSPRTLYADLPPHTTVDIEAGTYDDGYESSNSESSIIDMPRRRVAPLDAESIGEVAENASASVISVVAGIGGIVRRSASRGLLGTSPGYGTFDQ
ncbi:hypothetical protein A1Q2_05784 [Trichosporon asahii var. asahii CBS 8904]|uniref:Uncharacterized protein n=1 Tax=Trichosporon asahii var. asahii (strain CBS 8904) TaxID=1220162 RepID=K1VT91_TRIAC|nr:hypothetical protein A1Q2_05784 [Trichosporon asahii var. asahii CBS 8904]